MKRAFSLIFVFVFIFALSLPCFADNWGDISVNISTNFSGIAFSDSMSSGDYSSLIDIAIKSEQIGLFGGGTVAGLFVYWSSYANRDDQFEVYACVFGPNEPFLVSGTKRLQFEGYVTSDGVFRVRSYYSNGNVREQIDFYMYRLQNDGSWSLILNPESSDGVSYSELQLKTTINNSYGYSLITARDFTGEFVSFDNYKPLISDGGVTDRVQVVIDNYNLALIGNGTPIPQEDGNYLLDIPSIITSIPNAASLLLVNAFDFELFGINIAGFLSVVLVLAILGWLIAFLMKKG